MRLIIKYFGMLVETTNNTEEYMQTEVCSVLELVEKITNLYPDLRDKNFKVAVNQQLVNDDYVISSEAEIALLPPFAGG